MSQWPTNGEFQQFTAKLHVPIVKISQWFDVCTPPMGCLYAHKWAAGNSACTVQAPTLKHLASSRIKTPIEPCQHRLVKKEILPTPLFLIIETKVCVLLRLTELLICFVCFDN